MKSPLTCLLLFCFLLAGKAQTRQAVSYFPLQDIKLLESPFLQAQQTDLHYIMAMNPDRLLAPFLREAGLAPKAPSYTNWENTGLDGHIGGHYISALSMMYAATGDTTVYNRLNYMLNELHRAQQAVGNGFIGGTPGSLQLWKEIKEGSIRPESFSLNGKWVPLYNIHKTYAGLRDAYLYAGSDLARQMLIALTDWMAGITSGLTEQQMQDMLRSEHGGLNEIFADVADITGDKKYLELARRFSHKTLLEPLIGGEDHLTGMHANTQIPKVIGYKRIADLTQNDAWDQAARFFWNTVVNHRSVCIGGNSVREHFHPADNFTSMLNDVQGPETCNTYNDEDAFPDFSRHPLCRLLRTRPIQPYPCLTTTGKRRFCLLHPYAFGTLSCLFATGNIHVVLRRFRVGEPHQIRRIHLCPCKGHFVCKLIHPLPPDLERTEIDTGTRKPFPR